MIMNEVRKLHDGDGYSINQFSNNYSFCSAKTLNPAEQKQEYR